MSGEVDSYQLFRIGYTNLPNRLCVMGVRSKTQTVIRVKSVQCYPKLIHFTGTDDDDTILKSFDAFENNGKIDAEM